MYGYTYDHETQDTERFTDIITKYRSKVFRYITLFDKIYEYFASCVKIMKNVLKLDKYQQTTKNIITR